MSTAAVSVSLYPQRTPASVWVFRWLVLCCLLVYAMVVVGGITRLTQSGLSIVEWQPIVGALPPLTDAAWEEAFAKYRASPQYQKVNAGMTLAQFKPIFWWEYFHRLLGRALGLVFLLPLVYFAAARKIVPPQLYSLFGLFALGAAQGALGWYMVKSGLIDNPRVSHLRLAAHLGLAVLIYIGLLWSALGMCATRSRPPALRAPRRYAFLLAATVFVMILSGALVAGLHAGLVYNTFPLMHGRLVPAEMFALTPWYSNFLNNIATVQFDHRLLAWLLAFTVPLFWWRTRRYPQLPPRARFALNALLVMLCIQISLGIATLLLAVPVALGVAHQAGAILLLSAALWVAHELSV